MNRNNWIGFENLRRAVRNFIGYRSRLYQAGSAILDFMAVVSKEGIGTWVTLRRLQKCTSQQLPAVPVAFRGVKHPILIRPGTEDPGMIISTVIREEYGQFQATTQPEWMIDAGAYIGDTSAYFLSRFPRLKLVALEPNPPAFLMTKQNLAPYGDRAILLPKALSVTEQSLRFGGGFGGASIQPTGVEVEATSIPALLEKFAIPRLGILKMDVEGEEEAIFSSSPEGWLARVDLLIIEIHGPVALGIVSRVLQQNGFSMREYRSIWYCRRERVG